jgi:hypothetical protein
MLHEMRIIHEFLADRQALITAGDPADYAESLVWQSAGGGSHTRLTHSFFHTHLKRRITMIIKTHPTPRYLSRILALPLFFLLFTAFATRQPVSHDYPKALLRFYNHQLRFPQAALDANQQGVVNFIIKVGANGKLAGFEARPADFTPPASQQLLAITVTARPSVHPVTTPDNEGVFWEEVRKASNKLGEDKFQVDEGVYYLKIRFKIEKR